MTGRTFRGLGVSPGLATGPVYIVDRRRLKVPRYQIQIGRRPHEVARFEKAVEAVSTQFKELKIRADEGGLSQVSSLIEAHEMLLRDDALMGATRKRIEDEGHNAEWALKSTVREVKRMFDRLERDYFRERRSDVDIVGERLLRNLVGDRTDPLEGLPEDSVVVAHDLSPADTIALARQNVLAFVTETGGRTSHTAIIARALNVPSVLSVHSILEHVGSGDQVIVDGRTGEVVHQPAEAVVARFASLKRRRMEEERALLADIKLPSETMDGVPISLLGNIEVSQEIDLAISHGGTGIGLYRTEFLQLERPDVRGYLDHFEVYRDMVKRLAGRPFVIRSLDIGADKVAPSSSGQNGGGERAPSNPSITLSIEASPLNPALGLRAVRLSLRERIPFREQLKGIVLASGHGPVRLLIPFVTTLEEIQEVRREIERIKDDLRAEGRDFDAQLPIGVMIETPAAAMMADIFAEESDFFAIGTNDLIQYMLAADRSDDEVAYLYRPAHPALLRTLNNVSKIAASTKTPLSICGEMAADPFFTPLLIGLGVHSLSMNPSSIPVIKRMVRRLDMRQCQDFAREALTYKTADEVERYLAAHLKAWVPDLIT